MAAKALTEDLAKAHEYSQGGRGRPPPLSTHAFIVPGSPLSRFKRPSNGLSVIIARIIMCRLEFCRALRVFRVLLGIRF